MNLLTGSIADKVFQMAPGGLGQTLRHLSILRLDGSIQESQGDLQFTPFILNAEVFPHDQNLASNSGWPGWHPKLGAASLRRRNATGCALTPSIRTASIDGSCRIITIARR